MKLYEIDQSILECFDENGELINEEKFNSLVMEREKKIEGMALLIKNLDSDIVALSAEKKNIDERLKAKKNKRESVYKFLGYVLDGQPFETAKVSLSYRKSSGLVVLNKDDLMNWLEAEGKLELMKYSKDLNNEAIKKAISSGTEIPYAFIEDRNNLQLK